MQMIFELIDEEAFIGKNGGLTSEGITNVALISQSMNAAKQQIKDYGEALEKLNEDLENGNISTSEYEEQQKDFLSAIRDSVGVVEDYKDEIIDLWKAQLEAEMMLSKIALISIKNYFKQRKTTILIVGMLEARQKKSIRLRLKLAPFPE